jgi:uncharacterized membrane protein
VVVLVLGLVIFLGVHSLRAIAPAGRDSMIRSLGEGPYKGLYSFAAIVGLALVVWGFSLAAADGGFLYLPPIGLRHVTEALMLPALVLAVASVLPPGYLRRSVRHPLLIATILWSLAHLLVNGETAAVVLFGGFLAWAVLDLLAQGRRQAPPPVRPMAMYDVVALVVGLALYGALIWRVHLWAFGVSPLV